MIREDREKKLTEVLFRLAELWMVCNKEEEKIVKERLEKFMRDIVQGKKEKERV